MRTAAEESGPQDYKFTSILPMNLSPPSSLSLWWSLCLSCCLFGGTSHHHHKRTREREDGATVPLLFCGLSLVVRLSSLSLPLLFVVVPLSLSLLFVVVAFLPFFLRWLTYPLLFVGSTGVFLTCRGKGKPPPPQKREREKGEAATPEAEEITSQDAAMQKMERRAGRGRKSEEGKVGRRKGTDNASE